MNNTLPKICLSRGVPGTLNLKYPKTCATMKNAPIKFTPPTTNNVLGFHAVLELNW